MGRWKKGLIGGLSLLLLLVGSGFVYEWGASSLAKRQYPPTGKLVDVGGYRLHVDRMGQGSPTIILEAGSGETSLSWKDIPQELSQYATVVCYDRGGYAWSDEANTPRTGANIVKELHTALENEGIPGPYLLVGHSLGGMYARLFAQTYRDEVAGLVLIDARPENDARDTADIYARESVSGKPPAWVSTLLKRSGWLRLLRDPLLNGLVPKEERQTFVNVIATPNYFDAVDEEGSLTDSVEDVIREQDLGNLPVRIIARGLPQDYALSGISEEGGRQLEEIWQQGQRGMLDISDNSRLIVAEKSGHMVIHDEPELVVDVIKELLDNKDIP
ncbi:alpha/beta fold hydrolase [Cohnella boryungensis]